jgi:hypothetical protein
MVYRKSFVAVMLLTVATVCSTASAQVLVNRSPTVITPSPYFRLAPTGRFYGNWSTFGNSNSYVGRTPYPLANYGNDVFVDGGTYGYYPPDDDFYNNYSTYPNRYPYAEQAETRRAYPSDYGPDFSSAEESITPPPGRDLSRSAPPADRLKSRVTYRRRPTYKFRFEPTVFDRR